MEFQTAGGKSRLQVEPGSTIMITNRPVWAVYIIYHFLKVFLL